MRLISIIGAAIVGLIVGGIAKWLSSGPNPSGCLITILIGVAGVVRRPLHRQHAVRLVPG